MSDGTFVDAISNLAPKPSIVGEATFVPPGWNLHLDPMFEARQVVTSTLTSVRDMLATLSAEDRPRAVAIIQPGHVELVSVIQPERRNTRAQWLKAERTPSKFAFGSYLGSEDFLIQAMVAFVHTPARDSLLALLSNLKDTKETSVTDNGIAQEIAYRAGVQTASEAVKNPVTLIPHAPYPEVQPVDETFIVRIRGGGQPQVALFRVPDPLVEQEYRDRIHAWLTKECEGLAIIG